MKELQDVAAVNLLLGPFASDDFKAGVLWALDTAYGVAVKAYDAGEYTERDLAAVQGITDTGMEEAGASFGIDVSFQYTEDAKEIS